MRISNFCLAAVFVPTADRIMTQPWDLRIVIFLTLVLACLPCCFAAAGGDEEQAGPEEVTPALYSSTC